MKLTLTLERYAELQAIFDRGLRSGIGDDYRTCLEGAIALVVDGELSAQPSCSSSVDARWGLTINDGLWSSIRVRAKELFPVAVAQIGTADLVRTDWVERVALGTVRRVVPLALDAVGLSEHAARCRGAADLSTAHDAAFAAYAAAADLANNAAAPWRSAAAIDAAADYAEAAVRLVLEGAGLFSHESIANAAEAACQAAEAAFHAAGRSRHAADTILREAVRVALDAYASEGRHRPDKEHTP